MYTMLCATKARGSVLHCLFIIYSNDIEIKVSMIIYILCNLEFSQLISHILFSRSGKKLPIAL